MSGSTSSLSKDLEPVSTPKPRFRGRLHQAALVIAVPASVRLAGAAPSGSVRVAMIIRLIACFCRRSSRPSIRVKPRFRCVCRP